MERIILSDTQAFAAERDNALRSRKYGIIAERLHIVRFLSEDA